MYLKPPLLVEEDKDHSDLNLVCFLFLSLSLSCVLCLGPLLDTRIHGTAVCNDCQTCPHLPHFPSNSCLSFTPFILDDISISQPLS